MRLTCIAFILILITSCKSDTDKLIGDYESKVIDYEELVNEGTEKNKEKIMAMGDDINAIMDALGTKELSDEQQAEVTGISLRFQVSIMMVQQETSKNMDAKIDSILNGLETIEIEPIELDTL